MRIRILNIDDYMQSGGEGGLSIRFICSNIPT